MQISRIRLSDKTSRLHPRHVVPKPAQAYELEVPKEWLAAVIDKTSTMQARLLEQINTVEATFGGRVVELKGLSSDRAPSPTRIDSWITVQVLEFFVNRINLLRWAKRVFIFS
jgi:hypothetical protein